MLFGTSGPAKKKSHQNFSATNALTKPSIRYQRSRESDLQSRILRKLKKDFPTIFVYKASDMFQAGIPDIVGCWQGKFFAIEVKVHPNRPTKLQLHVLDAIRKAGGLAGIAYDVEQAINIIKNNSPE